MEKLCPLLLNISKKCVIICLGVWGIKKIIIKGKYMTKLYYLLLMALFGCLGPVVRAIGLPSVVTACLRAWISSLTLMGYMAATKHKVSKEEIKGYLKPMIVCGVLLFGDWFGLFMSYQYTTIATATVCYYIVPILVLIGSLIILKEKFKIRHLICAVIAFAGMFFVSGVAPDGFGATDIRGPLFALLGAVSYAGVVLINKKKPEGDPMVRTTIQLFVAALFTTPYVCLTTDFSELSFTWKTVGLLLLLGVAMTAVTYIWYFSLILKIPSRTVAIFSYADPIVAVLISVFFMAEPMGLYGIIGTVMIIGAAIVSEI